MKKIISVIFFCFLFVACKFNKDIAKTSSNMINNSTDAITQQTIVYKTTRNFDDYVPVIMNAERTKIISYPAPTDVLYQGKPTKPTALKHDYLLDNRGITVNVVFLNYTYEDYSKMKEAPTMNEMLKNIKEKYPLKELIYCGSRYQFKDEVKDLNAIIDTGFPNCKKVKIIPMAVNLDL